MKRFFFAIVLGTLFASVSLGIFSVVYVLLPYENKMRSDISDEIKICVESFDNTKLVAEVHVKNSDSHDWVILVHSYRTDHTVMYPYAEEYLERGYNVLLPDNRAHGNSGGTFIGMGYLDQFDLAEWVDYIIGFDSQANIVIHGLSMGAATAMIYSGNESMPENVKAIIEDCGYSSAADYLSWKLKQRFRLPSFPAIPIANVSFRITAGYYLNQASALEAVEKSKTPILFIHGTKDTTVPVENAYLLYNAAANCEREMYIVEGAKHGGSLNASPSNYWSHVFGFINRFF